LTPVPRSRPLLAVLLALVLAATIAACGGSDSEPRGPEVGVKGEERDAAEDLGFPAFATKNTTRVGGGDSIATAAAVARAVYPGVEPATRPKAVTLVDKDDWQAGIAAASLIADPVGAPVLLTDGDEVPEATREALDALSPTGAREIAGAQVLRVGKVPEIEGRKSTDVAGTTGAEIAARIDALGAAARGRTSDRVLIVPSEKADLAMPAAGWAAKSGDPVLFTERDALPRATREALGRHQQPKIYVLGDDDVVSAKVVRELRRLGSVKRIEGGPDALQSSIAFARYVDGSFGWGVVDPGHGLVFVNGERPLDAVAAAPLSSSGSYGPILVHPGGARLPRPLESYLLDIRPGYDPDPVRGVYNHGWVIGDEAAMPVAVQSRIDALLEITAVEADPEPSS
jgi:putative cell wall-binding protein